MDAKGLLNVNTESHRVECDQDSAFMQTDSCAAVV